jgi:hypothetical protein
MKRREIFCVGESITNLGQAILDFCPIHISQNSLPAQVAAGRTHLIVLDGK